MRVVGGSCKGRNLASFKGLSIRPTSDKVREAVFNILPRDFPFERVLDLFAGTGALGIEALSRGASYAVFTESDGAALSVIRKNLEACGLLDKSRICRRQAAAALGEFGRAGESFDLIFIDPPYGKGLVEDALRAVDGLGLLAPEGMIVAETSRQAPLMEVFKTIEVIDERKYGDTLVYFLALKEDSDG